VFRKTRRCDHSLKVSPSAVGAIGDEATTLRGKTPKQPGEKGIAEDEHTTTSFASTVASVEENVDSLDAIHGRSDVFGQE